MKPAGFTLVELLVVISLTSILGITSYVSFKSFSQDQVLTKAYIETQSILRLAQSNATSSFVCNNAGSASWLVKFREDKTSVDLTCGTDNSSKKSVSLAGVEVSIKCSPVASAEDPCVQNGGFYPPLDISFAPLSGAISFIEQEGGNFCTNDDTLMVILKNLQNDSRKCFTVSKGGAINVH